MLLSLKISNLATIQGVEIQIPRGFTILTGETGAGKSILIDALQLLLGKKPDSDLIRTGADKAQIEVSFQCEHNLKVKNLLDELEISLEDEMRVRYSLLPGNKQKAFVNDVSISRAKLEEIMRELLHIHGQHDNQSLMNVDIHVDFLDGYGQLLDDREQVAQSYLQYQQLQKALKMLELQKQNASEREQLLQFQLQELEQAEIQENEDELLAQEYQLLSNASKLSLLYQKALNLLHEEEGAIIERLGVTLKTLSEIERIDPQAQEYRENLESSLYQCQDNFREIADRAGRIADDPQRLEWVNQRLSQLQTLKRKYNASVNELRERLKNISAELGGLDNIDESLQKSQALLQECRRQLLAQAQALSTKRHQAAVGLDRAVLRELHDLGMEKARFNTQLLTPDLDNAEEILAQVNAEGIDEVEFLLSVNPGQELRSLNKVASGGELSRIMLALQTVLQAQDPIETLVFDEIDTGISGRIAEIVGSKLKSLGHTRQTLCITHLPQIVAFAENHYAIQKTMDQAATFTRVDLLEENQKIQELARLMGGKEISKQAIQLAREMIQNARKKMIA